MDLGDGLDDMDMGLGDDQSLDPMIKEQNYSFNPDDALDMNLDTSKY
jgi:hypothetical protein